VPGSQKLQMTA